MYIVLWIETNKYYNRATREFDASETDASPVDSDEWEMIFYKYDEQVKAIPVT